MRWRCDATASPPVPGGEAGQQSGLRGLSDSVAKTDTFDLFDQSRAFQIEQLGREFLVAVCSAQALNDQLAFHVGNDVLEVDAFFRDLDHRYVSHRVAVLDFSRQIAGKNRGPGAGQGDHSFDEILKLTNVA